MLARRFLRLHLHRNTVAEWLRRRSGVWRLDKASLNHYLETALRVQFPEFDVISDLTNSALAPAEIGNISSVDKAQQQQSPTLANSLKSDDLSHFRKISVHAMLQLSKLAGLLVHLLFPIPERVAVQDIHRGHQRHHSIIQVHEYTQRECEREEGVVSPSC